MQPDWSIARSDLTRLQVIGKGAFGSVCKSKWRGMVVATKELNIFDTASPQYATLKEEFIQEAEIMAQLRHPRIALFLGMCVDPGKPVIMVQEYLEGGSFQDLLARLMQSGGNVGRSTLVQYMTEVGQGMVYLHNCSQGPIIHRDLKPANLLLDKHGHCKVADFGLAKVLPQHKKAEDRFKLTGETGSYRYMAPEVTRHETYGTAVDVFSFAMVMYGLGVGKPPFGNLDGTSAEVREGSGRVPGGFREGSGKGKPPFGNLDGISAEVSWRRPLFRGGCR